MPLRPPNPALANRGPFGVFQRLLLGGGSISSQVYPAYTGSGGIIISGTGITSTNVYGPGAGGAHRVAAAPRRRVTA